MNIIYLMIPLALMLAGGFIWACMWALSSGQFDDLETPSFRILKNEDLLVSKTTTTENGDKENVQ